jgi:threonine dehydratase
MSTDRIVTAEHVEAAARRLAGNAVVTPLLHFPELDARIGGRVLIKPETLQIAGSFKFRGAFNRLSQLGGAERRAGVIAWSSGNHAQGVAAASARLGIAATIVMPSDAPTTKIDNTRRLGASVHFYDRANESRENIARALISERGGTLVPSYDDPHVIAGQGTAGLEIAEQATAMMGCVPDIILVPCGGGGFVAGCATALCARRADAQVYAVEPATFDDTTRSLAAGKRLANRVGAASICDALLAPEPGELTFPINERLLAGGLAVSDQMVLDAMAFAWRELKLVVEPGGAVALAALLNGLVSAKGKLIAVVLSGGNVDRPVFVRALSAATN